MSDALIQKFTALVNEGLANNENRADAVYTALRSETEDAELLDLLKQTFEAAYRPPSFNNVRITEPGMLLDQAYALLSAVMDADILDPKAAFSKPMLAALEHGTILDYAMVGRFWSVAGLQRYRPDGTLAEFSYDPLAITSSVAAVVTGDYIPLETHVGLGIGGVGQAVSRVGMRGQRHGKYTSEAFESEMSSIAMQHGQQLRLMILEAEPTARSFWAHLGYRYPENTRYMQPPIDYDRVSGDALYPAVPELLMVKPMNGASTTEIERDLLIDAVRSMYRKWYVFDYVPESARERVEQYVFGTLFQDFIDSLPPGSDPIRLVDPPSA